MPIMKLFERVQGNYSEKNIKENYQEKLLRKISKGNS